jgi:TonB family protein
MLDKVDVFGATEAQAASLRQRLRLVEGQTYTGDVLTEAQIQAAAREVGIESSLSMLTVNGMGNNRVRLALGFGGNQPFGGRVPRTVATPFGAVVVPGGAQQTPFGVVGAQVRQLTPVAKVDPVYPALARQARIQGVVVMHVSLNTQGMPENIRVVTGHPLLIQAAIDAVKQWTYGPQPEAVVTEAVINFAF